MTAGERPVRLAVVGSYGTGLTMRTPRVPGPGETLSGATFSAGPGGKGSNQAIGAARLGAQVSLLTAIGADDFGAAAQSLWAAEGVDASGVVIAPEPTMVGVILVEDGGENRIVLAPGALDFLDPRHVAAFAQRIGEAELLMVCNEIPVATVVAALQAARHRGVKTLFNPAPARDLPADARHLVDYLTPNLPEARVLAGVEGDSADIATVLDRLRQLYSATIVLTAGSDGCYVDDASTGARTHVAPIQPPAVVDTTGAGDAFNAAFATALSRGATAVEAARYGNAAGAFAVGRPEVIPGLATRAELAALLGENTPPPLYSKDTP